MINMLFLKVLICFLPWKLRRIVLTRCFGYKIAKSAHIGLSFIYPKYLEMHEGSCIGHLNVAVHLEELILGQNSTIGRQNWITGFPKENKKHFVKNVSRRASLIVGKESAITKQHHLDCTDFISIGDYTTIAGYRSTFLTHAIDVYENIQSCHPIVIGDYCFVSTDVRILGGSKLPNRSILGAGAVLNKQFEEEYALYAGVPAEKKKTIANTARYFFREKGFVD